MARFTVKYLENLKPKAKEYIQAEGGTGLYARVYPDGRKALVFYYTSPLDGRRRKILLGDWPDTSLKKARERMKKPAALVDDGKDPLEEADKEKGRRRKTIGDLADIFIEEHSRPKKKSWAEDQRILATYVLSQWSRRPMVDIAPVDVRTLIKKVDKENGGVQSNRVLACVRKMFSYAQDEHLLEDNPAAGVKRIHREIGRDRVLTKSEVQSFWVGLDQTTVAGGLKGALRFILLTACRPGEAVTAKWEDVDGDWLTLPETKAGRSHRIYLTELAREIMGEPQEAGLVFLGGGGREIPVNDLGKAVRQNLDDLGAVSPWTPHDLRRTAGTMMSEEGTRREVLVRILNNADHGTTAIYDRHSYDPEASKAWRKWSRRLKNIIESKADEKVVPIR